MVRIAVTTPSLIESVLTRCVCVCGSFVLRRGSGVCACKQRSGLRCRRCRPPLSCCVVLCCWCRVLISLLPFHRRSNNAFLRVFFKDGTYRSYVLTAYVIRSASTTTTSTTDPRFVCVCRVCAGASTSSTAQDVCDLIQQKFEFVRDLATRCGYACRYHPNTTPSLSLFSNTRSCSNQTKAGYLSTFPFKTAFNQASPRSTPRPTLDKISPEHAREFAKVALARARTRGRKKAAMYGLNPPLHHFRLLSACQGFSGSFPPWGKIWLYLLAV